MKVSILSASTMDAYERCSMNYYFGKEARLTKKPSRTAHVGSCFHQGMEVYITHEYQYSFADCVRQANKTPGFDHFDDTVVEEAIAIGHEWLLEHKLPEPVKLGDMQFPQAEMAFGPPGDVIYGKVVEPGNAITFKSGLKVHGLIDMIHPEFDRFGNCTMVVTDWKTNRYPPKDIHNKRQPQLYALVVHRLTGLPVRCEFWYVRNAHSGPRTYQPSIEEFDEIEQNLLDVQKRITDDTNPCGTPSLDACHYCDYNYACSEFTNWLAKDHPQFSQSWETLPINQLADVFEFYRDRFLIVKKTRKEIQSVILQRMQQAGLKELDDWYITYSYETKWTPHAEEVIRDWGGLDLMPENLRNELVMHHMVRDIGSPYLRRKS